MSAVWRENSDLHKICNIRRMHEPCLRFEVANLGGNCYWGLESPFLHKKICLSELKKGLAFNMKHHKSVLTFKVWSFLFCIKNLR